MADADITYKRAVTDKEADTLIDKFLDIWDMLILRIGTR